MQSRLIWDWVQKRAIDFVLDVGSKQTLFQLDRASVCGQRMLPVSQLVELGQRLYNHPQANLVLSGAVFDGPNS